MVRGGAYGINDFVDNGDGTVTDNSSGMTWQQTDSGKGMNWEAALSHCENLSLAGKDDWRLPNAKELQYIVDYERSPDTTASAAIDPVFSSSSITNEAGQKDYPFYWTSTTHLKSNGIGDYAAYIGFGRCIGQMNGKTIDVHGAGCQRSDPKIGDEKDYPVLGHGPQGDASRVFNYARCVRGGKVILSQGSEMKESTVSSDNPGFSEQPTESIDASIGYGPEPPKEAILACSGKMDNVDCSIKTPDGKFFSGNCKAISNGQIVCVPKN